ncbi:fimbrial protein [Pseudomonas donghuensis]|uniref:fimbrial protein n=1 Tax=Pseudomonas donghuensis TaxID=1163398 RepID=UPI00215E0D9B|nr:fimbrial protein [Pseudomonas donghuensis]UVL26846.1 fimbrial protein [Pseudomonas donghuensis]
MIKFVRWLIIYITTSATSFTFAACDFYEGHSQKQIIISIPSALSIPRDAANNTIIYESPPVTFTGNASYTCSSAFTSGIINNLGNNSSENYFPIGNTGLSWQWIYQGTPYIGFGGGSSRSPGGYGFNNTTHFLRIIKTGNISTGTTIPAGTIGFVQVESAALRPLAMTIDKSSTVIPQSCETPNFAVEMGEYNLSTFSQYGNSTEAKSFSIKLNNCPSGIKKVTYSFFANPATPAWNPSLGIVELNKNSTAKGIALQILDSNLEPVQFGATYTYSEYAIDGGNYSIPMNARYIRTLPSGSSGQYDSGMSAGTANSEITFIMSYL